MIHEGIYGQVICRFALFLACALGLSRGHNKLYACNAQSMIFQAILKSLSRLHGWLGRQRVEVRGLLASDRASRGAG